MSSCVSQKWPFQPSKQMHSKGLLQYPFWQPCLFIHCEHSSPSYPSLQLQSSGCWQYPYVLRKMFVRINYTLSHHIISYEHWRISLFNIPRFRCIRPYIQEFHMLFPCIHCSIDIQMVDLHNDRTHMSFFSHILYSLDPSIQDGTLEY